MIRLLLLLSFYFLSYSQNSNVDITIYKKSILTIIDSKSTIEVLADGFKVAEGPLWDSKSERLLFSDVKQNKIFMNLRQLCVDELHEYGIEIYTKYSPCSYTENDHFFSWRRDPGNPLRNLTIAWL